MLNFVDLYKELKNQRYFSIIIHSKPGTGLSEFAQKAAKKINANYVNLHSRFLDDEELSNKIQKFTDQDFHNFLVKETKNEKPIIVDNIDFLLDTWKKDEKKAFVNLFRRQWDTWNPTYKVPLIVFMESHPFISELNIEFDNSKPKIYKLSEFSAL